MAKTLPRASVYLTDDLNEKIELECERTKLSKNRLILKILEEYFENSEKESSGDEGGADLREEVLDFFRSDEGRELVKEFVEKMKQE